MSLIRVASVGSGMTEQTPPQRLRDCIADDEILDSRWSAVSQSHHAFTIDRKHGVAFLPAGRTGEVIDYTNGSLERVHIVETDAPPERARYVDDYLYVFAGTEVAVVDETDWTRARTLQLGDN